MDSYIGISESRLHHIIGVARKAYQLAKDMGCDEDYARKMFMIGWVHDVGYEFSRNQAEHNKISSDMLFQLVNSEPLKTTHAIQHHGRYSDDAVSNLAWKIINMADMQIDSNGNEVGVMDRLTDIKERYGEHSDQYLTACDICYRIGLTATNLAALAT